MFAKKILLTYHFIVQFGRKAHLGLDLLALLYMSEACEPK